MVLAVRRVCCRAICRGTFSSEGGISKINGLCVWVEMCH